jgi:hypothetical protein
MYLLYVGTILATTVVFIEINQVESIIDSDVSMRPISHGVQQQQEQQQNQQQFVSSVFFVEFGYASSNSTLSDEAMARRNQQELCDTD